jgi:hypothetical protein
MFRCAMSVTTCCCIWLGAEPPSDMLTTFARLDMQRSMPCAMREDGAEPLSSNTFTM